MLLEWLLCYLVLYYIVVFDELLLILYGKIDENVLVVINVIEGLVILLQILIELVLVEVFVDVMEILNVDVIVGFLQMGLDSIVVLLVVQVVCCCGIVLWVRLMVECDIICEFVVVIDFDVVWQVLVNDVGELILVLFNIYWFYEYGDLCWLV